MAPDDGVLTDRDLASLVETGRALASEVELSALLRTILERATALTDSPDSSVILFDERRRALYFAEATGESREVVLGRWGRTSDQRLPVEGSKAGSVFSTGRPIVEEAVGRDPEHFKGVDQDTQSPTRSMICVPLTVGGKRLGVVQLLNKRTGNYTSRDQVLLEHFASQAAVALRNAQLIEQLVLHMGLYMGEHSGRAEGEQGRGPLGLLAELERPAHTEELTVLFADMRGFTQLCHMVGRPERIQELLNQFLALLADTAIAADGVVNKFLGDGLMALFRGGDHAARAVRCAARILDGFALLRAEWAETSSVQLDAIDIGIGIATDYVILGSIGSERVRDFTAVGAAVNLAAHLMEHARDGRRILVDRRTRQLAKDVLGSVDAAEQFSLQKPGQAVGIPYERYCVRSLADGSGLGLEAGSAAPARARSSGPQRASRSVFVSYSHKDKPWLEALRMHLKPYVRTGSIESWDDTRIREGALWRAEIDAALARAAAAVLLVSPHFLSSDFIAEHELPPLLDAARGKGLTILWVPVSASSYGETEIAKYQAALEPGRPLDTLTSAEQNRAWVELCQRIKALLQDG